MNKNEIQTKIEKLWKYLKTDDESLLTDQQKEKMPLFKLFRVLFVIGALILPLIIAIYLFVTLTNQSPLVGIPFAIALWKFFPSFYKDLIKKINFEKYSDKNKDL